MTRHTSEAPLRLVSGASADGPVANVSAQADAASAQADAASAKADTDFPEIGGTSPRWLAILRISQFLFEAREPPRVAQRAVSCLGLLPEVLWAALDATPAKLVADLSVVLGHNGGPILGVRLAEDASTETRATIETLLGTVRAIYIREEEIARLRSEAQTDALTGLWNRRGFEPLTRAALCRADRTAEDLSVLVCDIDRFKTVNDTLGHDAGDKLLREIASAIGGVIRPGDLAARLGGDEIAILLTGCNATGATHVAERLRKRLRTLRVGGDAGSGTAVSVSIGIADTNVLNEPLRGPGSYEQLVRAADEALYSAKRAGRDRWVCHPHCYRPAAAFEEEATQPIRLPAAC